VKLHRHRAHKEPAQVGAVARPDSRPTALALLAIAALVAAGCASTPTPPPPPPSATILILGMNGTAVPNAQIAAVAGNETLLAFNAGPDGRFERGLIPAAATGIIVAGPYQRAIVAANASALPSEITLIHAHVPVAEGILAFRPVIELPCTTPDQVPNAADCAQFGEPVMEVAGDGAIWASGTCCIYKAPPIWVSRNNGSSFTQLRNTDTGLVRDAYGIEGDFAIDDAGNVYFFDLGPVSPFALTGAPVDAPGTCAAVTIWVTSYTAAGVHRWTRAWPVDMNVDRPWVRAGKENQVFIAYNTCTGTAFYASTDGGQTWNGNVIPPHQFPCPLGNLGQGVNRSDLYIAAPCFDGSDLSSITVWSSHDSGATWDDGQKVPLPDVPFNKTAGRGIEVMNPPVGDEAGNVYVPFTHFLDAKNSQNAVFMGHRLPSGAWAPSVQVSAAGMNRLPWPAAGRGGHVGLAWYAANGTFEHEADADWHLMAAASVDADAVDPHYQLAVADGSVLWHGRYGRALGDFIETDITPDGKLAVVYAQRNAGSSAGGVTTVDDNVTIRFIQTDGGFDLAPRVFKNGPHPSA
jgi:hypothetical protein